MEPRTVAESPRRAEQQYRQAEPEQREAPRKPRDLGWIKWVVIMAAVALVAVLGWLFWPKDGSIAATIDSDKYQAVFLSNGQVYFGNLSIVSGDFMKLTNVYYLERQLTADTNDESDANTQPTTENENNFQLLKYSDVLYGSEDAMIISRDDIIRYENLRSDGVVARAIANRS